MLARALTWACAAICACLLAALAAPVALADGDPASDVLLGENVFYPYSPPASASIQKTLNAQTAAARRAGFPLKVALIGSPVDLGVVPDLFRKPQQYADFLDQEISFQTKQPLLVVMSNGYGVQGLSPAATSVAARLPKPSGTGSTALATAAIGAVAKLAAASGHQVKGVPGAGDSGSGSGTTTLIIAILAAAALAVAVALVVLRRRQRAPAR